MTQTPHAQRWFTSALLLIAGAAAAAILFGLTTLAVVEFGWFNVTATTPHSPFAAWAIHTTMIHAVQREAKSIIAPERFTQAQMARGFRAYDSHCVACHGAPGIRRALWVNGLNPPPPYLLDAARRWTPAEFKFVIGNGVKMTAMPVGRLTFRCRDLGGGRLSGTASLHNAGGVRGAASARKQAARGTLTSMDKRTIPVRAATPDDAEFLGWAMFVAARGHLPRGWFDIVLQRDEKFCLKFCARLATAKARSWWHWSLFSIAEANGNRASALCGFGDESVYRASFEAMHEACVATGIDAAEEAELWPRGSFILSATTSEPGAWTVENVGTLPEARGTGVTEVLLEHEFTRARAAGFRRAQISFLIGNEAAERAYRKVGFEFAQEKRAPDFEAACGSPGLRRFVRNL